MSTTPAGAYDPTKPFEGGQLGAYVMGFVSKFSTDAPPVLPPFGSSTSNPPPPSAPAGAPSNIHAVIVSGLSDPAKVIVSSNVTSSPVDHPTRAGNLRFAASAAVICPDSVSFDGRDRRLREKWFAPIDLLDLESGTKDHSGLRLAYGRKNSTGDAEHHRRPYRSPGSHCRLSICQPSTYRLSLRVPKRFGADR
jgi:hypothetical protein